MEIKVQSLIKKFNYYPALDNVSFTVKHGELIALLGPSGCGKTTLLRMLAGLEVPDSGRIEFDGVDVQDIIAKERNVGFVFQHYALFKHMTIFENVSFGLRVRKRKLRPSKDEIRDRVMNLLKLVQLANMENRFPHELSGGQRQRVALARALAVEPKVLLLDEPFGALDAQVRKELRRWLRKLHDDIHITSIFVTHDQEEALEVSDRIVLMNRGKIEQIGTPDDVYKNPASPFVFQFLGNVNLFHGRSEASDILTETSLDAPDEISGRVHSESSRASKGVVLGYVRPHEIELDLERKHASDYFGRITAVQRLGSITRIALIDSQTQQAIDAEVPYLQSENQRLAPGLDVFYRVRNMKVFEDDFVI